MTQNDEWPKVRNRIDSGEPTTLCLIRVEGFSANPAENHQVVGYRYDLDSTAKHVTIWVYDPNYPNNDSVKLEFDLDRPNSNINAKQSSGERLRGFFEIRYDRDINVHIHQMNRDGTVGARIDQRVWSGGWTQAKYFYVGNELFLFLLKKKNGYVHIHKIKSDGSVGERIAKYDWSSDWTSTCLYDIGGKTFLLLLKRDGGSFMCIK
jgi:hypothetical protein